MELNQERIENGIIAEVADKLISDDSLWDRAKTAFDTRVEKLWRETAEERIRTEIELAISNGFERSYLKTDGFGHSKGEKTTIRAELEKLIGDYWNTSVGRDGKPDSNGYNRTTRAEWMMAKMCAEDFAGEMKQHVVNVAGSLKDAFRLELHETVNRLLSEIFKVKSADDQNPNNYDAKAKRMIPAA